jgi:hypothetical protein
MKNAGAEVAKLAEKFDTNFNPAIGATFKEKIGEFMSSNAGSVTED